MNYPKTSNCRELIGHLRKRKDIREITDLFRKQLKGFEKSYLLDTAFYGRDKGNKANYR